MNKKLLVIICFIILIISILIVSLLITSSFTNNTVDNTYNLVTDISITDNLLNQADEANDIYSDIIGLSLSEEEFPKLDGSTATIPLGEALAAFMMSKDRGECKKYTKFSGTNDAYKRLVDRKADLLLVYEKPNDADEYLQHNSTEIEMVAIGKDALVFFVNAKNPINNLSYEQIVDIYSGKITNWKDVGGQDKDIAAFQRNETSGSQTLMIKLVMKGEALMPARENYISHTMSGIINAIADYDNGQFAIGYNMYYYVTEMNEDPNIKILSIDKIFANKATILGGEYPFVNDFYAAIRKNTPEQNPERLLFRWLQSTEGQALIESEGYSILSKK